MKRKRPLLVPVSVALIMLVVSAWLLTKWLTQPYDEVVFVVTAYTGVLRSAPHCNEKLVWDLPAGRVRRRSEESGAESVDEDLPTTVTFHGGALARLERRPSGKLSLTIDAGDVDACPSEIERRIIVRHGGKILPSDRIGYEYISSPVDGEGHAMAALRLTGQVILGDDLPDGAGWSSSTPLLQTGEYRARHVHGSRSREMSVYLEEQLDAGAVVDTMPSSEPVDKSGSFSASGFVQVSGALLNVQLYAPRSISISAYAGNAITLSVSRWRVLVRSAAAQIVLMFIAALGGIIGLTFSAMEAMPNHKFSRYVRRILREEEQ